MKVTFSEPAMEDKIMDSRDAIDRMKVFNRLRWDASVVVGGKTIHQDDPRFNSKRFTKKQEKIMLEMQGYILDSICDELLPEGMNWELTDDGVTIGDYGFSVAPVISEEGLGMRYHGVRFYVLNPHGEESELFHDAKHAIIEAAMQEFKCQMQSKATRISLSKKLNP
jgi:hypothetical protein